MGGEGAIPAYGVRDRLRMSYRERNLAIVDRAPQDWVGEVIDEDADTIVVRSPDGGRVVVDRINGHEIVTSRRRPRWVAMERVGDDQGACEDARSS